MVPVGGEGEGCRTLPLFPLLPPISLKGVMERGEDIFSQGPDLWVVHTTLSLTPLQPLFLVLQTSNFPLSHTAMGTKSQKFHLLTL